METVGRAICRVEGGGVVDGIWDCRDDGGGGEGEGEGGECGRKSKTDYRCCLTNDSKVS